MGGVVFPISPKIFHPAAAGMVELLQRFAGCAAGIAYGVAAACTHQKPPRRSGVPLLPLHKAQPAGSASAAPLHRQIRPAGMTAAMASSIFRLSALNSSIKIRSLLTHWFS